MLTFEKGNPERLAGKAVIYAHNRIAPYGEFNPEYVSAIMGPSPSDMFEIMEKAGEIPQEARAFIESQYRKIWGTKKDFESGKKQVLTVFGKFKGTIRELADKMECDHLKNLADNDIGSIMGILERRRFAPFCGLVVNNFDVNSCNMDGMEYDQIRTADVSGPDSACSLVGAASEVYRITYYEQMTRRMEGGHSGLKRYGDMSPDEFKAAFRGVFRALTRKRKSEPVQAQADLLQITMDSPFMADALKLVEYSKFMSRDEAKDAMRMMRDRIMAVLDERYEDAAEMSERLRGLPDF